MSWLNPKFRSTTVLVSLKFRKVENGEVGFRLSYPTDIYRHIIMRPLK